MSCGKLVFPSYYLRLPILDVPSHVVTSSSHLITCHFSSWKSHVMWKTRFSISLPAISHLGCLCFPGNPMSCVNLITYSHVICPKNGKYLPVWSAHNSHVMCKKNNAKSIHKSHVMCQKTSAKSAAKYRVICAYYIYIHMYIYIYVYILMYINGY